MSAKKNIEFLYKYLNNYSPTGYETSGQKIWLDYLKPYIDTYFTDPYGTAVAVINPEAEYKVVIEAHADEISWCINHITKDGCIHVIRNGGSDYHIAPSMRAKILTEQGVTIPAVFGYPAIHVRRAEDKKSEFNIKTIVLDGGFSSDKEVKEKGVHVGNIVIFEQDLTELNDQFWVGRGLDNRMGGFMIAEVARMLHEKKSKIDFGLYIVNAVQEEIGLRGASMISRRIKPDVAIITDVTHDTQTMGYCKIKQGDISCKKGGVLTYAPSVQRNVRRILEQVAQKHKIPFQRAASSPGTHTDTDAFAYSGKGVPSALISLPLKYMHTTVEMVCQDDVKNIIHWMYQFLVQLRTGHDFNYFT